MSSSQRRPGVVPGRLDPADYAAAFADCAPPLDPHRARVAADRCYFCHDAPCTAACPTGIDIPLFIRQIATGTPEAAARTILSANILGGTCARVCPTEVLCEGNCVRVAAGEAPVEIGLLQRFATDRAMAAPQPFTRAAATGRRIAVVGAGPAGLACAHRLAMLGHEVTIHEARPRPGGLNEYGLAAYKMVDDFAAREIDWLMGIGGITIEHGRVLGADLNLADLRDGFDAVFLGLGLGGTNALDCPGADLAEPATDFIARLRQADDLSEVPVGRRVVVIGGGMTAIDAAVQARLLGAEDVAIVYRRDRDAMPASEHEQDHATSAGVRIVECAAPKALARTDAGIAVAFAYTEAGPDGLVVTDETFTLTADQVFTAIGQTLLPPEGFETQRGRIAIGPAGRTSVPGVWAGGDCAQGGEELTVTAVAQGRDAALDIHASLQG
ncbi:NAD(P)-dependent oxidoreductase [Phaeovulum vinaykumarii]|uniref:dihydrouracil dehydrogenase (NAD(+)) n=1 Tax=Phaeovulum vinaykumarii TaxID=407234 RepID=A0A1N7LLV3_9RHOB|nr:NAD(P)-dependent oxidoreductase [Phaeovulum vinaykumarii]SIS74764.1 glutamate synthase (NADPH/NADH) small chain [Phaeovulum vinaykumarii]SOC05246.1 NADPH-dependent glutamate synthase beta subunit-like oxidoreductase [Phaeovulum vinaykumarii]